MLQEKRPFVDAVEGPLSSSEEGRENGRVAVAVGRDVEFEERLVKCFESVVCCVGGVLVLKNKNVHQF